MTDEKWQTLINQAKKDFSDVSYETEDLFAESNGEMVKQGTQDILQFTNDQGTFKVVRQNRPVVLEKKMHYSHRAGDAARTEYVLSDQEMSHKVLFHMLNDLDEWEQIESNNPDLA